MEPLNKDREWETVIIKKVFIPRDYSKGTNICFETKFPEELADYIKPQIFIKFVETLNSMYAEAEKMDTKICMESCFACITAYIIYLCFDTHFDKCLKKISAYIAAQNETVFNPCHLNVVDPIERGLRVIEVAIFERRRVSQRIDSTT